MRVRAALSALAFGALLLTGCTAPADEPPATSAAATVTPTPTPEPSPTPTDGIQVHSDPETGIVFEDAPDLTGDEAEVYNWVAIFQRAFWETARTNRASQTFATMTSSAVQAQMEKIASDNASAGVRSGGTFTTWIRDIVITVDPESGVATATAVACDDLRQATFTTDAGEFTAEDVQQHIPKRNKFELLRLENGVWSVQNIVGDGTC